MYTASVKQIGRIFRDKREKEGREVGAMTSKLFTLCKFTQTKQTKV